MNTEQKYLPKSILDKAIISGNEYGWKREDFKEVIKSALSVGLGISGGQIQFKFPDGTCELYWKNLDTNEKSVKETWNEYCLRTKKECLDKFDKIPDNRKLEKEAIENFDFLKEKSHQGIKIEEYLILIIYFDDSETDKQIKLWTDFNATSDYGLRLNCQGTINELNRRKIELKKGMKLILWDEDLNEKNEEDNLIVEAVAKFNNKTGIWEGKFDWKNVKHESEI